MKCLRCGHDSKYKDRTGRKCPSCNQEFAFEPQAGDPFTDLAFDKAIRAISGDGTVRFLPAHVWYQLAGRRTSRAWVVALPVAAAIGSALVLVFSGSIALCLAVAGAALAAIALGLYLAPASPGVSSLPRHRFDDAWSRWLAVHGKPAGLIEPRRQEKKRSYELDQELRSYSFDRAVICDRPELVDVLIANRFHFENNCAVLSIDGHPAGAFDTVRAMLANNPKLLVLAIHDASPEGCRLAHRLATDPEWFAKTGRVVDVGLRPAHAKHFPGRVLAVQHRVVPDDAISEDEARWLSSHRLEAMAIRPEQLIKRLYRAMTEVEGGSWDGGSGGVYLLGDHSGTVDGGADSFG